MWNEQKVNQLSFVFFAISIILLGRSIFIDQYFESLRFGYALNFGIYHHYIGAMFIFVGVCFLILLLRKNR